MRRRLGGVLLIAGLLTAVACSGGANTTAATEATDTTTAAKTPTTDDSGGRSGAPALGEIEWQECESGAECGTLDVPVDYDDAGAGTLTLGLIRLPAGDPDRRIGALLVNPGGPGGTGVDFARFFPFPDQISDRGV